MLFNSAVFLVFATLFYAGWPLAGRSRNLRWIYLTVASFVFYGWWDWRFLFLIVFSGCIDYFAALGMVRFPRRRALLLLASILANVGSLAIFKYADFAVDNLNAILSLLQLEASVPEAGLILPVGISFYTFQSMSYTIDVYRGELKPTHNPFHFFAYLSMFPQLVAGPIVRAATLLPQLEHYRKPSEAQRWEGSRLVVYGFFKKVVVADTLAPVVNAAFAAHGSYEGGVFWWLVMIMFAFQIYCDFSGYSDIARGLAKWMGYEFPLNFDHPYVASSIREFWSRWHISLSTWFRDYVYVPLGGSRSGPSRAHANMWITMLVSGLWHGAAWTFVIWGALHAFYLSLERTTRWPERLGRLPGGRFVGASLVFVLVLVSWVFFRADSFGQAIYVLHRMTSPAALRGSLLEGTIGATPLVLVALMVLRQWWCYLEFDRREWIRGPFRPAIESLGLALLATACVFFRGPGSAFIYFQF